MPIMQELGPLSVFQLVLLTTDGIVSRMIEAYAGERVDLVKLAHRELTPPIRRALPELELEDEHRLIERTVLLRGANTLTNFLHAEAVIVPDRLDAKVCQELRQTKRPIGLLLSDHRVETYREVLSAERRPAGRLGRYFGTEEGTSMLSRRYRIVTGKCPAILITETFPASTFCERASRTLPWCGHLS